MKQGNIDKKLVAIYIQEGPPFFWMNWWFALQDTPTGDLLHRVLFDGEGLRDLTSPAVREAVLKCALSHQDLFKLVLKDAVTSINAPPKPPEDPAVIAERERFLQTFVYQCGLRPGDQITLVKDLIVRDHKGKPTRIHPTGEIWSVLGPSSDRTVIWLRQADGKPHTWTDDADSIAEQFRKL